MMSDEIKKAMDDAKLDEEIQKKENQENGFEKNLKNNQDEKEFQENNPKKSEKKGPQQKKVDKKDETIKELTDMLQRLQAEFENFKKRNEKEKSECIKYASKDIIAKLLPIIDNFELALKNKDNEEFVKGVELIYSQLLGVLEQEGLKPMDAEGKQFDPYLHEALMTEESKEKENTVLEVFQKGYTLKENILRHAKVKVAKNADKKQ